MAKSKLKRLVRETYLQMIKNSAGSRMFRNFFVINERGRKKDILKNGRDSCAFYLSFILKMFSLISSPHTTIKSTLKDMLKNNWKETKELRPGNIILWEKKKIGESRNFHIGFYIGGNKAVSNDYYKRTPIAHHFTYGIKKNGQPSRKIKKIFTHPDIKENEIPGK